MIDMAKRKVHDGDFEVTEFDDGVVYLRLPDKDEHLFVKVEKSRDKGHFTVRAGSRYMGYSKKKPDAMVKAKRILAGKTGRKYEKFDGRAV